MIEIVVRFCPTQLFHLELLDFAVGRKLPRSAEWKNLIKLIIGGQAPTVLLSCSRSPPESSVFKAKRIKRITFYEFQSLTYACMASDSFIRLNWHLMRTSVQFARMPICSPSPSLSPPLYSIICERLKCTRSRRHDFRLIVDVCARSDKKDVVSRCVRSSACVTLKNK